MANSDRQNRIYSYIKEKQSVRVSELIGKFHVTDMTIRRDLDKLESIGLINRVHGGAKIASTNSSESLFETRIVENMDKKRRIARRALEHITNNLTFYIDGSTTCYEIVKILPNDKNLTIFTDSFEALILLRNRLDKISVFLIGGELSKDSNTLDGYIAVETAQKLFVDACFISCGGFTIDGFTNTGMIGSQVKKLILKNAKKRYLIADSTKYNKRGLYMLGGWDTIDTLITDDELSYEAQMELKKRQIELILA